MNLKFVDIESVECLDEFENEEVYDLEVEDNHNFFANDILVHNSSFFSIAPLTEEYCNKHGKTIKDLNRDDITEILKIVDDFVKNTINKVCQEATKNELYSDDSTRIEFKREALSLEGAFFSKKHYFLHIVDKENIPADDFKYVGIDVKKNEFPQAVKYSLQELYERTCRERWTERDYIEAMQKIWDGFSKLSFDEISYYKGYYTKRDSTDFLKMEKGSTIHSKSATFYNHVIEKLNIIDKYQKAQVGEIIRSCYIIPNNQYGLSIIGFKDSCPKEFEEIFEVDYQKMFEKMILKPCKEFTKLVGWAEFNPTSKSEVDIFAIS